MPTHTEIKSSVASRDGTEIAYWTSGSGPPIVLVHGSPADHARWHPLIPYLEHITFMPSTGEAEVPAATLRSTAGAGVRGRRGGGGCNCGYNGRDRGRLRPFARRHRRFGAATLTAHIRKLVLYEGWPVPDPSIYALPPDVMRRMDKLLTEGDRDGVVEALFRSVEEMSDDDMALLRSAPSWPGRVAAAHTVTRELVAETQARLEAEQAAKITSAPHRLVRCEGR